MREPATRSCTAFGGDRRIASGDLVEVVKTVKEIIDHGDQAPVLIFDDSSGEIVEVDFRGTEEDVLKKLKTPPASVESTAALSKSAPDSRRGPGRPRLGVVSREVTLLPRHWSWLNSQPGGASVALRKLVEEARRVNRDRDKIRHAQEVAYRFMNAMAGDLPGFEEALRALFAADPDRFNEAAASWPTDIRDHAGNLSRAAFRNRGHAIAD